jgi:hypothetical protein
VMNRIGVEKILLKAEQLRLVKRVNGTTGGGQIQRSPEMIQREAVTAGAITFVVATSGAASSTGLAAVAGGSTVAAGAGGAGAGAAIVSNPIGWIVGAIILAIVLILGIAWLISEFSGPSTETQPENRSRPGPRRGRQHRPQPQPGPMPPGGGPVREPETERQQPEDAAMRFQVQWGTGQGGPTFSQPAYAPAAKGVTVRQAENAMMIAWNKVDSKEAKTAAIPARDKQLRTIKSAPPGGGVWGNWNRTVKFQYLRFKDARVDVVNERGHNLRFCIWLMN